MQGGATVFREHYKGMVVDHKNVRCWHQHPRRGPAPLPPPARCGCAPRNAAAVVDVAQVSPRPVTWSTHVRRALHAEHR
eukprot:4241040-Prymnesium_polylepis.1